MGKEFYIGLDIGGTKCAATVAYIERKPNIVDKEKFSTLGKTPVDILEIFSLFIEKHLKDKKIISIGISCGGPLDSKKGVIMSPPSLPLWDNIEIVKYFEEKYRIKTFLQNDANACAVAEWKFGAGIGSRNMIFLTFGTGLGAGLILDGKLYVGQNDNAGEIGHVRLTKSGPLGYYKNGSCEGYCSGGGIARLAQIMSRKRIYAQKSRALLEKVGGVEKITAKDVAELAFSGDRFCLAVFNKSAKMLGRTLSILVDVLNPELIVIGGVYMRTEKLFARQMLKVMKEECLSHSFSVVKVLPAKLNEEIGDYSALAVAKGDF